MREYQHPTPLVRSITLGLASAEAARRALETVHEYRYNPSQPRDARGRWTSAESGRAANTARRAAARHEEAHPESRHPEPPSDSHAPDPAHSARSGLKAHLHLVAAHVAYAAGNHAAAAHHLARAEHHLAQASEEHGVKGRIKTDMEGLKGALKAHTHSADLSGLRVYGYDPSQPRDHTGKWTSGNATAEQHEAGASHHAARRLEAKEAKNTPAAARHHTSQLFHELAAAHKGGKDTELPLKNLSRAMDTLHVQYREAKERNKPQAEIDEKKAAYDHFNEQFKTVKKAIKGKADFPALTHYGAEANAPAGVTGGSDGTKSQQADEEVKTHLAAGHEALKAGKLSLAGQHLEAAESASGPQHAADVKHLQQSIAAEILGEAPPEKPTSASASQNGKTPSVGEGEKPHEAPASASSFAELADKTKAAEMAALPTHVKNAVKLAMEGKTKEALEVAHTAKFGAHANPDDQEAAYAAHDFASAQHSAFTGASNTASHGHAVLAAAKLQESPHLSKTAKAELAKHAEVHKALEAVHTARGWADGDGKSLAKAYGVANKHGLAEAYAPAFDTVQAHLSLAGKARMEAAKGLKTTDNLKTPNNAMASESVASNAATAPLKLPSFGQGSGDGSVGAAQLGGGFGAVSSANTVNPKWETAPYHKEVQAAAEAHKGQWKIIPKGQGYHAAGPHAEVTLPDGGKLKIRHSSASSYPTNASGKIKTGATTTTHTLTMDRYDAAGKFVGSDEIRQHKNNEYKKEEGDKKDAAMYRYVRDKLGINPGKLGMYAHGGAAEEPASYAMRHAEAAQRDDAPADERDIHTGLALAHQALAQKQPKQAKEHLAQLIKEHGVEKLAAGPFASSLKVLQAQLGVGPAEKPAIAAPKAGYEGKY